MAVLKSLLTLGEVSPVSYPNGCNKTELTALLFTDMANSPLLSKKESTKQFKTILRMEQMDEIKASNSKWSEFKSSPVSGFSKSGK